MTKGNSGLFNKSGDRYSMPSNDAQIKHIFRPKKGHFEKDTASNRRKLLELVNNEENLVGISSLGVRWYAKDMPDGTQLWASVKDGIIQNGGINETKLDITKYLH